MAQPETKQPQRSAAEVRRDIDAERDRLARSVDSLRDEIGAATDIGGKLRSRLPVVAAAALGAGFFLFGGVGATMRYFARRGRGGDEKVSVGRFRLVDRED